MPLTIKPVIAGEPDLETVPRRVDRKLAAELVSRFFFPVGVRSFESWALDWRIMNNKAVCDTAELFAAAQAKVDAAPRAHSLRPPRV
jgi:hypothetical protein